MLLIHMPWLSSCWADGLCPILASARHSPPSPPRCLLLLGPKYLLPLPALLPQVLTSWASALLISPNSTQTFVTIFVFSKLISNYLTKVCHLLSAKTLADGEANPFSISLLTLSITAWPLFQNRMIPLLLKVNVL